MRHLLRLGPLCFFALIFAPWTPAASGLAADPAAVSAADVAPLLGEPLVSPTQTLADVKDFVRSRLPQLAPAGDAEPWRTHAAELRRKLLRDVVLRGEAARWSAADTACRVEWRETLEVNDAYRIRKLRFEALPGLWIPALLYEPAELKGRMPVVLNVNGHDSKGKAAPYKQIRCINQVRRGMLALNVEWLGMGQLRGEGFGHYRMNQLDLCGTSGLAPFYLSMRRALDLLLAHPHADPSRVAVAGLSGGGWQTIMISALDPRVTLSNPVAGYSGFATRLDFSSDLGDSEQTPCDMATVADYTHLTAMLAPRAALLTFNSRDNCCFASDHALPPLLDAARPAYAALGHPDRLRSHVNTDPGTHNFERDNRQALYGMFRDFFFAGQGDAEEIECAGELQSAEQLWVELPEDNLNFQLLALQAAESLPEAAWTLDDPNAEPPSLAAAEAWQAERRAAVRAAARPPSHSAKQTVAEAESATKKETPAEAKPFAAERWRLRLNGDWTAPVVVLTPAAATPAPGTTLLLCDQGRGAPKVAERVAELLRAGRRVAVWDPFYFGECKLPERDFLYALLVATVGERPLGIQAGQLNAVAAWLRQGRPEGPVVVECLGRRCSLIGLTAAAVDPAAIDRLELRESLGALKQVVEENLGVDQAPELFCFGLLKVTEIRHLTALAAPRPVVFHEPDERVRRELAPLGRWYGVWGSQFDPLSKAPQ